MASEFYQITGGDEVLLVGPGQAHCRKLDITTAANLRLGFFISFCKMTAKDAAYTVSDSDSVSIGTSDRNIGLLIGVRKYATALLGSSGEYFAGLSGTGTTLTLQNSGGNNFGGTSPSLKPGTFLDTEAYFGAGETWNITPASGVYASFVGLKFTVVDGNAYIGFQNFGAVTDLSKENLQYRLANMSATWTSYAAGRGAAITNSDSIYIQNPFVYSGIRIHAYGFMVAA